MPNGDPLGPVQIGAREIYDAVVRVGNAVERLTDQHADLDRTVESHETQLRELAPVPKQIGDHEGRIRVLEAARWPLPTLAVLAAVAALVIGLLPYIR